MHKGWRAQGQRQEAHAYAVAHVSVTLSIASRYMLLYVVVHVQVVPPMKLTLEQLKEYGGEDRSKPILLAIRGVIFDVTKGMLPSA